MSAYFELVGWRWVVGNCILFKMSLGWKISDKVWRSYAWSKFGWLFLWNPNLATFGFWWIWGHSLRNHNQPLIKWWIWLQNIDVYQKSWSLTVNWSKLTFCPIQLIFNHLTNWLSKLVLQGLKFSMRIPWYIWEIMKSTWGIRSTIFFKKSKILVVHCLGGGFVWSTLE